ncbi:hypothetical protein N9P07_05240 [Alphaproteobacteria bacterium]|nr:hypothetical protein [Alphaproteobacteria bacterium]
MTYQIFRDNDTCVTLEEGDSYKPTVICFNGVHPKLEWNNFGACFGNKIWVQDVNYSWGNNLNFEGISEAINPFFSDTNISVGNSMGGFLSILTTKYFPINISISFVPQFSVKNTIIPNASEFPEYTDRISNWRYPSLDGHFNSNTKYMIFSTDSVREQKHWRKIKNAPNIHKFIFKNTKHSLAMDLKKMGVLYSLIEECIIHDNLQPFLELHLNLKNILII